MLRMDNIISIVYDNHTYTINKYDSLQTLLQRGELLALPLSVWKEIFEKKSGKCFPEILLQVLKAAIVAYDSSSKVNAFNIFGSEYWLDKSTRVGLMHLANCSPDNMQLVLGTQVLEIPVDIAKQFLTQLEVYAGQCYLVTQKHLLAIRELKTVEDIINYDYTKGYPDKITFNA